MFRFVYRQIDRQPVGVTVEIKAWLSWEWESPGWFRWQSWKLLAQQVENLSQRTLANQIIRSWPPIIMQVSLEICVSDKSESTSLWGISNYSILQILNKEFGTFGGFYDSELYSEHDLCFCRYFWLMKESWLDLPASLQKSCMFLNILLLVCS